LKPNISDFVLKQQGRGVRGRELTALVIIAVSAIRVLRTAVCRFNGSDSSSGDSQNGRDERKSELHFNSVQYVG
jgi:hypothetical protein